MNEGLENGPTLIKNTNYKTVQENVKSFITDAHRTMAIIEPDYSVKKAENKAKVETPVILEKTKSNKMLVLGTDTEVELVFVDKMLEAAPVNEKRQEESLKDTSGARDKAATETATEGNDELSWWEGAQVVSACIEAGIDLVQRRLNKKVEKVVNEIENEGIAAKEGIQVASIAELNPKEELVLLTYSNGAKEATQNFRNATQKVTLGIRDKATEKIFEVGEALDEAEVGKKIIPQEQNREVLAAVGKVALSGLGAAAVSLDVMINTTETFALTGNKVAADVVGHRYGKTAGQVVENAGESVYNTFRALKLTGLLNTQAMTGAVVKNTGKTTLHQTSSLSQKDQK